jgi:hypothetical protein
MLQELASLRASQKQLALVQQAQRDAQDKFNADRNLKRIGHKLIWKRPSDFDLRIKKLHDARRTTKSIQQMVTNMRNLVIHQVIASIGSHSSPKNASSFFHVFHFCAQGFDYQDHFDPQGMNQNEHWSFCKEIYQLLNKEQHKIILTWAHVQGQSIIQLLNCNGYDVISRPKKTMARVEYKFDSNWNVFKAFSDLSACRVIVRSNGKTPMAILVQEWTDKVRTFIMNSIPGVQCFQRNQGEDIVHYLFVKLPTGVVIELQVGHPFAPSIFGWDSARRLCHQCYKAKKADKCSKPCSECLERQAKTPNFWVSYKPIYNADGTPHMVKKWGSDEMVPQIKSAYEVIKDTLLATIDEGSVKQQAPLNRILVLEAMNAVCAAQPDVTMDWLMASDTFSFIDQ